MDVDFSPTGCTKKILSGGSLDHNYAIPPSAEFVKQSELGTYNEGTTVNEFAWKTQVGDDNLVSWGKENHYSLTTFAQKARSLFVMEGSRSIEIRFTKDSAAVGDTITLVDHDLKGRDLDALIKSPDNDDAKDVRTATIAKTEKKEP